ncbi:hypothetical protein WA026_008561 [Henosepilachna vigintioctopunctata]|uniref:Uncharacterized protein n=1 Tax=Henosepilachna vigintioctopunctata TaxID=420089 RepID=A0AAW1UJZ0_9CUCU
MADGRKKLSGYEYRKRALDKSKKEQEDLSKTPKLDDFFKKKECVIQQSESMKDCTHLDHEGGGTRFAFYSKQTPSTSNSTNSTTTPSLPQNINHEDEPEATVPTINVEEVASQNLFVISDDPGECIINDFTRDHIATYGSKQNKNFNFSGTKRDYNDGTS